MEGKLEISDGKLASRRERLKLPKEGSFELRATHPQTQGRVLDPPAPKHELLNWLHTDEQS